MDCLIKIIKGPGEGEEFHCSTAETVVGRSPRSHVRLASPTVSFEHAVILRAGDDFFVENLSAGGTFVNDERISGRVRLRAKDRLRLGQDTVLRVEAVPAGAGDPGRRRLLMGLVLLLVLTLMIVVIWDPISARTQNLNWTRVYAKLDSFVHSEVAAGILPTEAETHMQKAWRLRSAGDPASAAAEWLRLRILLSSLEDKTAFQAASDSNRRALADLLQPKDHAPEPTPDDLGAALIQFLDQMRKRSTPTHHPQSSTEVHRGR